MKPQYTAKAVRLIEEGFKLDQRVWELLDLIVAEWESDPSSVACFDLELVIEAKLIIQRRKELDKKDVIGNRFS